MSLTSRLSSSFSQESPPNAAIQSAQLGFTETEYEVNGTRQMTMKGPMKAKTLEDLDDELKRPPYEHVSIFPA